MPIDETRPATFEDGSTTKVVKGEGTYTVAPDGTVTFTPEKDFEGKAKGVIVKRYDKKGTPILASYTPLVTPQTSFVDTKGNVIEGYPTEDGTTPKKDIPGYKFVETKTLENGDTQHVYEKVSPSPVSPSTPGKETTTTWTDEKGNPLKPTEPGSKEPGTIPGYEYVKTVTAQNGNIRHIFQKVEMPAPTPVEPSQPGQPATPTMPEQPAKPQVPAIPTQPVQEAQATVSQETEAKRELPNTGTEDNASLAALGLLGALSGFGLVARKKKED